MAPTTIIYRPEGDREKEKMLTHFARNQQFILHNLMGFQQLQQDKRRIEMIDGSVITIGSCYGHDIIDIYVPRLDKESIVLPSCADRTVLFVLSTADGNIEIYSHDKATNTNTRLKTINFLHVGAQMRSIIEQRISSWTPTAEAMLDQLRNVAIMAVECDMNCIVIDCFTSNWRGNTAPNSSWEKIYNQWFKIKVPISFLDDSHIQYNLTYTFGLYAPQQIAMNFGGMFLHFTPPTTWGYGVEMYPISQYSNFGAIAYKWYDWNDGDEYQIVPHVAGILGGYFFIAECWFNTSIHGTAYNHGKLRLVPYSWGGGPNIAVKEVSFDYITKIHQIVGCDSRFFVIFAFAAYDSLISMGLMSASAPVSVEVFDLDLEVVIERCVIAGVEGTMVSKVTVVQEGKFNYLCFTTAVVNTTSTATVYATNKVYFVDVDTLTVARVSEIPTPYVGKAFQKWVGGGPAWGIPQFAAVSTPITCYMLDEINKYRMAYPGYSELVDYFVRYTLPNSYLGYSCKLENCARVHAYWCAENGVVQHEDENGQTVHYRAVDWGFRFASTGENMAFIDTTVFRTDKEQVDEVLRIWKASEGHNQNLLLREATTMGYATAMIPWRHETIHIGPGGTFEGDITLAPEQRGNIKIFVWDSAEG